MRNKGKLIIFEGPDFSGKSTQIKMIKQEMRNNRVLYTREPGSFLPESNYYCEELRKKILNNDLDVLEEAKIFAEARLEHTKEIVDLVNRGYFIICDRYIVSSFAYQGYAQELGKDKIYQLNKDVIDLLEKNNISIFCLKFAISQENWLQRKNERLTVSEADSIESKDIHDKVFDFYNDYNIYYDYTDKLNMFTHTIDANNDVYEMHKDVMNMINVLVK